MKRLTKHHQAILAKLPLPVAQWNNFHWRTRDSLIDNGYVRVSDDGKNIVRDKLRTITVYPEPFPLDVSWDATDDDIQNILDEMGYGSAGWKEGDITK